ncbi:hypothetical protein [Spiroplasma endosymbiont of Polydrusus pterygomalis]|uniref:hypothetical protein n=1 Tax=Spiroplasma endosymbiont of Polydrusus pterygomalis TaxID=3139327 RepID=UPI003CCAADC2
MGAVYRISLGKYFFWEILLFFGKKYCTLVSIRERKFKNINYIKVGLEANNY